MPPLSLNSVFADVLSFSLEVLGKASLPLLYMLVTE